MDIKETAIKAAMEAGRLLKENLGRIHTVQYKGEVDLVTEMDGIAEDIIVKRIKEGFPDHGILTEESKEEVSSSGYRWIVDPLDGTTNYAHGFPIFCISIAFEENGEVLLGVVYNPMLDELFVAEKGKGATLNERPIMISKTADLSSSLLATGFPYDIRTSANNNLDHFARFSLKVQAIRRAGSAALDLSYIACGRLDGFWELKLHPWDVAAATIIIMEAGGKITDFKGNPCSISSSETLATNSLIHDDMIEVLQKGL